jgi:hypothetical protein
MAPAAPKMAILRIGLLQWAYREVRRPVVVVRRLCVAGFREIPGDWFLHDFPRKSGLC